MSLVEFVIDKLDDLKGTEIVHFDVKGKSSITENMIICTGTSSRQVSAMADNLIAECKKAYENATSPDCKQKCSACGAACFKGGICYER